MHGFCENIRQSRDKITVPELALIGRDDTARTFAPAKGQAASSAGRLMVAGAVPLQPSLMEAPGASSTSAKDISSLLERSFGFASFLPNQEAVCRSVIEGRDVLLVMPTGSGKSLCYQLPALARGGTALVISPLIALMED
jgi:superfamily II DNA helicase RecQ